MIVRDCATQYHIIMITHRALPTENEIVNEVSYDSKIWSGNTVDIAEMQITSYRKSFLKARIIVVRLNYQLLLFLYSYLIKYLIFNRVIIWAEAPLI